MPYIRLTTYTAKELREKLLEVVHEISLANEDEIYSGSLDFSSTDEVRGSIAYDMEMHHDHSVSEKELRENLEFVPPHVIHTYNTYPEDCARDNDRYWEIVNDMKRDIFSDDISPFFPKKDEPSEEKDESKEGD